MRRSTDPFRQKYQELEEKYRSTINDILDLKRKLTIHKIKKLTDEEREEFYEEVESYSAKSARIIRKIFRPLFDMLRVRFNHDIEEPNFISDAPMIKFKENMDADDIATLILASNNSLMVANERLQSLIPLVEAIDAVLDMHKDFCVALCFADSATEMKAITAASIPLDIKAIELQVHEDKKSWDTRAAALKLSYEQLSRMLTAIELSSGEGRLNRRRAETQDVPLSLKRRK